MAVGISGPDTIQCFNNGTTALVFKQVVELERFRTDTGTYGFRIQQWAANTGRGSLGILGVVTSSGGIAAKSHGSVAIAGTPVLALINCTLGTRVSFGDVLIAVSGRPRFQKWTRRGTTSLNDRLTLSAASMPAGSISASTVAAITATSWAVTASTVVVSGTSIAISQNASNQIQSQPVTSASFGTFTKTSVVAALKRTASRFNRDVRRLNSLRAQYNQVVAMLGRLNTQYAELRTNVNSSSTEFKELLISTRSIRTQFNLLEVDVETRVRGRLNRSFSDIEKLFKVTKQVRAVYVGSTVLSGSAATGLVMLVNPVGLAD